MNYTKIRWKIYYIYIRINPSQNFERSIQFLHSTRGILFQTNLNHHVVSYVKFSSPFIQICISFIVCISFLNWSVDLFMQFMSMVCKWCSRFRHPSMMLGPRTQIYMMFKSITMHYLSFGLLRSNQVESFSHCGATNFFSAHPVFCWLGINLIICPL